MKNHFIVTILILLTCIANVAFSQPQNLKGIWVSAEQDLIEIRNLGRDSSNTVANKLLHEEYFHLFIFGDTLSFQHIYTESSTDFKIEYTDRYDLKIVKSNDSILVVKPVSKLSKAYFQGRPVLTLKKKDYLTDQTIVFKKLVYHATQAWSSPTIALQIDSSRNMYMHYTDNSYGRDKGLATGNYKAKLDEDTYHELIRQLQNCNLRTLKFGDIKGADSPEITLIVYFNGKRKYLKSMFPPKLTDDLLVFIWRRVQRYGEWVATEERRDLER